MKKAEQRENMNRIIRVLCTVMSALLLSGCASQGSGGVSIADFAGHSVSETTISLPEAETSPLTQDGGSAEPEESSADEPETAAKSD